MPIACKNVNQLWADILTETLKRLGLTCAVICPGSRSTPLAVAFAQQKPDIEAISILDERSAAFFALGQAKASGKPVVLVCTSGTAGANFYPAIIEARESRVPLLILTADRPPELRDCHSGQTIDQVKLYGTYPNWQTELALPSPDIGMLAYLRQTIIHAWEKSQTPSQGPVHLNIPLRDPLAPIPDGTDFSYLESQFHPEEFFAAVTNPIPFPITHYPLPIPSEWQQCDRGIIIAGIAQPKQPQQYCRAIALLSQTLKWPVLAEGLSPLRNYADLNPYLISTYDQILRNPQLAKQLAPQMVIQVGEMPTSKELRNWITSTQPQRWVIDPSDQNLDPLHGRTIHLRMNIEDWATREEDKGEKSFASLPDYLQLWCQAETQVREAVDQTLAKMEDLFEGKAAWLLSQILPPRTPLFIANSMPVRDVEFFWKPNNLAVRSHFNRGANGIDGTLSTALGMAHRHDSSVMLTGDLALLHDTNGFLIRNKFVGHLTILLINNNGGGIFEMLPIAKFDPPFEEFFGTPQDIDFAQLCATYGVEHQLITSCPQLQQKLNPLPNQGIRVLELQTNRQKDALWRQQNLPKLGMNI
ncbi:MULTISPECIES: 2-succinyl-5-enolpyruvyl-6-hydroxy-3-cyclohexene-1-carboxylic-acid synthase [unclassified Tolypothrix]|uniref:2-succinyl-5-enolpyruvyl-6-hydroxy-3- cyclohexene-1-carboxylic-acid synthase n=1 Tax=unclassified Tolypothrix TaxID=2649714 RepID=UPI0005EAA4C5|nr:MULTISPECIES: 2-succinyl-5-enolpyruvyl-6-hydroxy-3-cyclohexene-1-carboxylic-acid synthase [unclassified Tolypothrix]BAY93923.1 2-succinyl-6-hydroxy-2,4-cyclohexadiene-1-carboxylic acid synthase/2-oxoglutarate decarboxylase [Microchaete diplosiphon NIES-3275]EKF03577.1 2-succinyl-5-enolpyruvyl-6-hydroxy-3-cyclohexene-1-carboxylic-acid synthase [Tolypothrix sp. PCC 7601]MBE9086999.1 2-succinyl-5-enolpyruvyl-6-hydroxy-3-cyclohexene-1-carboxylic-acid synthase [Tolypothrix sp. LEGE 11397]UYD27702